MKDVLVKKIDVATGIVFSERYSRNGRLHRDPDLGPAMILRDEETGVIIKEEYKINGCFYRREGAAEIIRNVEGNLIYEAYWKNGVIHRDPAEGPAITQYDYENGFLGGRQTLKMEIYRQFGAEYRNSSQGPCRIKRDMISGRIIEQAFSPEEAVSLPRRPPGRLPRAKSRAP